MNRKSLILTTTLALAGLTACNPVPHVVRTAVTNQAPAATTTTTTEPPLCPTGQFPVNIGTPNFQCLVAEQPAQVEVSGRTPDQAPVPATITPAWANEHCPELLAPVPSFNAVAKYCPNVLMALAMKNGQV